jgi:hypothetical protein
VLCLHTAEFMTAAVAIYRAAGFRRDPAHDFEATSRLALEGVRPVPILAYRLDLAVPQHEEAVNLPPARVGERLVQLIRQLSPAVQRAIASQPIRSSR